ncbi:hypothetical protein BBH99_19905 [Chryseobacterium contaminans]|uniref:Lipocalin-like domain-containing protein n=1 Tax=Chryseobacterium contaminans TaxID=1423959 RepID=A0A1M7CKP5_9FLAO|nr:hypothetical protein [Chryseobacterium contaminans]OCA79027.1 hypothetical protein BBH99_19905 [Chryseobacterium contaminans]SHL67747.1 hypothetical protein SAMN05444407_105261 [Chryseobacterium contaminans]
MNVNKIQRLISSFIAMVLIGSIFLSCKSSGDNDVPAPTTGQNIDPIVGTFKGTIKIGVQDYYNAIVMVSKVDNSHVKVQPKSGEVYSVATPKILTAVNPVGVGVGGDDPEGSINYLISTKALQISTKKTSATDVEFYYEGTKQ